MRQRYVAGKCVSIVNNIRLILLLQYTEYGTMYSSGIMCQMTSDVGYLMAGFARKQPPGRDVTCDNIAADWEKTETLTPVCYRATY